MFHSRVLSSNEACSSEHIQPYPIWRVSCRHQMSLYPSLTITSHASSDGHWALIEGSTTTDSPLETKMLTRNPRMFVHTPSEDTRCIHYNFEAHFVLLFKGLTRDRQFDVLLQSLLPESNYHLCHGLPESMRKSVDFECARKWGFLFQRIDHMDCQLWFQSQVTPRPQQEPMCLRSAKPFQVTAKDLDNTSFCYSNM